MTDKHKKQTPPLHKVDVHTDRKRGGDKEPRQHEECLPVMEEKRWKRGRKKRRERERSMCYW